MSEAHNLTLNMADIIEACAVARWEDERNGYGRCEWASTSLANRQAFRRDALRYVQAALPRLAGALGIDIELFEVDWPELKEHE